MSNTLIVWLWIWNGIIVTFNALILRKLCVSTTFWFDQRSILPMKRTNKNCPFYFVASSFLLLMVDIFLIYFNVRSALSSPMALCVYVQNECGWNFVRPSSFLLNTSVTPVLTVIYGKLRKDDSLGYILFKSFWLPGEHSWNSLYTHNCFSFC